MIKLYQYENCPFCIKVRDFMDSHDIKYQKIEVNPDNKPKEVTMTGGTVPVIDDEGMIVSDSSLIINYLKKKFTL